jgi:filamentous hemagglutinin
VVTDEGAPEAAGAIGARAFTVGNRVFMGAGHDAGTDGGNLLAHELTHVSQQQGGAPPGSWDQLPFVDHGDQREVAARTHDGTRHSAGEQAIARDAAPDVDAAAYRRVFAAQIGQDVLAYLAAHELPTGSRFVTLPLPMLAAPALLGAGTANLESKLDGWLGHDKVNQLVDKARVKGRVEVADSKNNTWVEDKVGSGPQRWFPDVAAELGAALQQLLRQSLDRIVPRFINATIATAIADEEKSKHSLTEAPKPSLDKIIPSQPIDVSVIQALVAQARFDYPAYRLANPTEKGELGQLRHLTTQWEAPRNGTYWLRVLAPASPTVEEVANTLYGSSLKTGQIVVAAAPLFGLSSAEGLLEQHTRSLHALGADVTKSGDALAEGRSGPLADELAKHQGEQQPSKAQTKNDVLRSLDESIAILPSIEKSGAVFGMGKNPTVASLAPLRAKLTERRAKIATAANDKDALAWAGQVDSQQRILTQVSFGFDRHAKRLADLTKMVTDSAIKLGGFNLPPHVREAMNHVAMGYADVALLSELPATASPKLAAVEDEAGLLPVTFLEGTLEAIQRTIDDARDAKHDAAEHASYGVDDMRARQQALKVRLAALRIRVKTDPEGVTKELADIGKLTDGLQQESEIVGNLDSIDAAWNALDDGASWFWSFPTTYAKAQDLKATGDGYHARWKQIFADWKSKDPEKQKHAKAALDTLRKEEAFRAWFGTVGEVVKDARTQALIGKLVMLLVITVVTAGVGDLVAAGAAGWELSAGTTALAVGGAEAATFTALNQVFLDDNHSFGHVVYEFGANWAMFGVMRRFQAFAEVAELSKVKAVGGSTLIMAASTHAKADLDKVIHDGHHLNSEEIKQIALQGMAMAIAMHAIAPLTKPAFAELEGGVYSFAARIKANNRTRNALAVHAEGLKGTRDFKQAQEYVANEKAWLEEKLKILDEIEAQAKKEQEGGKPPADGIAAKLKMSPGDLAAMRGDIKSNIAKLDAGAQPMLHLEPKAPGVYTCSPDHIVEVTKALGEVTRVAEDPTTNVKTYDVKLPDGATVKVMERVDPTKAQWVTDLRAGLDGIQRARFDARTKGKSPAEIYDKFGGDTERAKAVAVGVDLPKDLVDIRAGLSESARAAFDSKYRESVRDPAKPTGHEVSAFRKSLDDAKARNNSDLQGALEREAATMKRPADPSGCFVAGTTVRTTGRDRAIETLATDDLVISTDVGTGLRAPARVVEPRVHRVPRLVDLELGEVTITCSPEHPFWVQGEGWKTAGVLADGDTLSTFDGPIAIRDIDHREGEFQVFNVEVEALHVYHVSALGILVHNKANAHSFFKNRRAIVEALTRNAETLTKLSGETATDDTVNKVNTTKRTDIAKRLAKLKSQIESAKKSTEDLTIAEEELVEPAKEEQAKIDEELDSLSHEVAEAKKPFATRMTELNDSVSSLEKRQHELNTRNDEALTAATAAREAATPQTKPEAEKNLKDASDRNKKLWALKDRLESLKRAAKLLHEDPSSDSGIAAQKDEATSIERQLAALENELAQGGMLGAKGPQITSKTLWEGPDGYERIDVENPNPGKRPGQIHYQPDKAHKWYYDAVKNEFFDQKTGKPAPKSVNDKLTDPEIRRAVDEGIRQLNGEAKK